MAIPPMDENLKELLLSFNANAVKYVVVGGYAVFVHAQPRMTKDIDISLNPASLMRRRSTPLSHSSALRSRTLRSPIYVSIACNSNRCLQSASIFCKI